MLIHSCFTVFHWSINRYHTRQFKRTTLKAAYPFATHAFQLFRGDPNPQLPDLYDPSAHHTFHQNPLLHQSDSRAEPTKPYNHVQLHSTFKNVLSTNQM